MANTLPTPDEHKEAFLADLRVAVKGTLKEYVEELRTDGELEDKRKFLVWAADKLGYSVPAPKETANLPMANIVINLSPVTPRNNGEVFDLRPTPSLLQYVDVNADVLTDD